MRSVSWVVLVAALASHRIGPTPATNSSTKASVSAPRIDHRSRGRRQSWCDRIPRSAPSPAAATSAPAEPPAGGRRGDGGRDAASSSDQGDELVGLHGGAHVVLHERVSRKYTADSTARNSASSSDSAVAAP